jgi:hypothetical protein
MYADQDFTHFTTGFWVVRAQVQHAGWAPFVKLNCPHAYLGGKKQVGLTWLFSLQ